MKTIKRLSLSVCIFAMLTGCATPAPLNFENAQSSEPNRELDKGKTLLLIGGILLAGAIVAHEAQDGVQDAIRSTEIPR